MMREYKEIDPDLHGRIVSITEDEVKHRREMEKTIVANSYKTARNNTLVGFCALIALGVLSYFFMINGHAVEGAGIAGSIGLVIGIFVYRKIITKGKEEVKEK